MKKIFLLATALFIGANINAQNVVDFESFTLPAAVDTFDNGSAGAGDFILNNVALSNVYNSSWGSWNGFSISNMTDTVTPGYANQYSSVTGSGANNSATYGVFYPDGTISHNAGGIFSSFKITNTTYAAISMRDGDMFGKKFGDSTDATGAYDGTNGEDFFKVWIIVTDAVGGQKDSMEFFLADYRFADSTQDYILKTWQTVDLTNFAFDVASISFRLESSDNSGGWMNTPAYFAIDDIAFGFAGVEELEIAIETFPNPVKDILTEKGDAGTLTLTNLNGQVVYSTAHQSMTKVDMSNLPNGIYLLKLENATGVVNRKIIK